MIPCVKDKCLKYPICKSKEKIDCKLIIEYYKYLTELHDNAVQSWDILYKHFPNLKILVTVKEMI